MDLLNVLRKLHAVIFFAYGWARDKLLGGEPPGQQEKHDASDTSHKNYTPAQCRTGATVPAEEPAEKPAEKPVWLRKRSKASQYKRDPGRTGPCAKMPTQPAEDTNNKSCQPRQSSPHAKKSAHSSKDIKKEKSQAPPGRTRPGAKPHAKISTKEKEPQDNRNKQ